MQTIKDLDVTDKWQNVHTLSGIAVDKPIELFNKGVSWLILHESSVIPSDIENSGRLISNSHNNYAEYTHNPVAPSLPLWIKTVRGSTTTTSTVSVKALT